MQTLKFGIILSTLMLSGCGVILALPFAVPHFSAPLSVWRINDFEPESKVLVLLTRGLYDNKIKESLAGYDFDIRSYPKGKTVIPNNELRYGLTFHYDRKQKCMTQNNEWLIEGVYEISRLESNEVVMKLEKGGVTGSCGDFRDQIFPDMAKALSDSWGY